MDKELKAMSSILKTLSDFDNETRYRIWGWIDTKVKEMNLTAIVDKEIPAPDNMASN